jgi:FKBP-type peptidyl-prolyl cis-trans isomerase (trigger factor)
MIREVFVAEKMELSTTELNDELYVMAQEYEIEAAEMWEMLKKNEAVDELHFRAISRKVANLLDECAESTTAA